MAARKLFPARAAIDEMTKRLNRLEHCSVVVADIRKRHGYVQRQYLRRLFHERHGVSPSAYYMAARERFMTETIKKSGNTMKTRRRIHARMTGLTFAGVESALYRLGFPKPTPSNAKGPLPRQDGGPIVILDSNNRPQTRENLLRELYR